jgi:hypothetical protein
MQLYRCRYLDSTGRIVRIGIDAEDDAEAIKMAQSMGANSSASASWLGLWQGKRCVQIIRHPTPSSAG